MSDPAEPFRRALHRRAEAAGLPVPRVASAAVGDGVARLVLDVLGLEPREREGLAAVAQAAAAEVGLASVRLAMTADRPRRRTIAVGSGKGGVGKSTLSANLAIALGRAGVRIGLVDADIYGPSQPRLLGLTARPEAEGQRIVAPAAQGIRALSIGQLVETGRALAWRGSMATKALAQLLDADWGDAELLVVDLPPGTGDVQLTLMQRWKPDAAVIVSTPQDLALIDAARAMDLFGQMGVPILGLVENMAGYLCPHCGEPSDPFGRGGAEAEAAGRGIPFLGRIPLDRAIRAASDAGTPPAAGDGPAAEPFRAIAARVLERLNQPSS